MNFVPDLPLSYAEMGQRARDMRQRLDDAGVAVVRCAHPTVQVALAAPPVSAPWGVADDPASSVTTSRTRYDLQRYALGRHVGTVYGADNIRRDTPDVEWRAMFNKRVPLSVMRRDLRNRGVTNLTLKRMPIAHVRSKWVRLCAPFHAYHSVSAMFVLAADVKQFFVHESSTRSKALALLHIMIEQGEIECRF